MRFVEDEDSKKEYKKFLEGHERCNFQQSLEWAEIKKANWKPEVILAEDEDKNIIGSLCVWIRKIPIFGNIMYASRGPVCDIHDIAVMKQLTDGIKELAQKYKAIVYKAEPDVESSDEEFRNIVTNLGYKIKDDAKNFREELLKSAIIKIKEVKINGFGKLKDKEINLEDGINVIYGKNEAGKSTLLKFITSMFYGLSKNKNGGTIPEVEKYEPWKAEEFSGKISYELGNEENYEVYRDFKKKNPKIFNKNLEDISKGFNIDKTKIFTYFFKARLL